MAVAHDPIVTEFYARVNITADRFERWLETEDSKAAGWTRNGSGESVGHHSGRHIVKILRKQRTHD